jgi:hypothetical protein
MSISAKAEIDAMLLRVREADVKNLGRGTDGSFCVNLVRQNRGLVHLMFRPWPRRQRCRD